MSVLAKRSVRRFGYRLRESHVRDHLAPLLSSGGVGAVKLDLALRSLVASQADTPGNGLVRPELSWERLYDLIRPAGELRSDSARKRNWVSDKLRMLEERQLVERVKEGTRRPGLRVFSDTGDGSPMVSATGTSDGWYLVVLNSIFTSGAITHWDAPEVAAYLAAMVAEQHARQDPAMRYLQYRVGEGVWSQPYSWFADTEGTRPSTHVRIPLTERTLRRGFKSFEQASIVVPRWVSRNPRSGERNLNGRPRRIYINGFRWLKPGGSVTDARVEAALTMIATRSRSTLGISQPDRAVATPPN